VSASPLREEDLGAWIDGELDAVRAAEVEAQVTAEPEASARAHAFREQKAMLHAAFDPVLGEAIPARLVHRRRPSFRVGRYAAVVLAALVGGTVGWWVRGEQNLLRATALPRQAAIAHAVFVPEVRYPVQVAGKEEAHLVAWLTKRLGTPVRAPRLGPLGYELLGGRLMPEPGRPGAQFMYQDANGRRLTL